MFDKLSISPVFRGLTPETIESLFAKIRYSIRAYEKGDLIVQMGDVCSSLNIILEGSIKAEILDFSGKAIKIEDIEASMPLAPAFLFGQKRVYPVNLGANCSVQILLIPQIEFVSLMQSNQIILTNFLNVISNRAQFLSSKMSFLSLKTLKAKIAHYILSQLPREEKQFILQKSQQELADSFGVARPSFARVWGEMIEQGLIHVEKKKVKVMDVESLRLLVG